MFDTLLDPATCGEVDPAAIVSAIREYHRAEAAAVSRKWAFIAKLVRYREAVAADEEQTWTHDTWAAVKDEVGAALSLTPRRASGQIRLAEALAERLPQVAALLEHGVISARVAAAIVYRTEFVDASAQEAVDAEIAERGGGLTTLSDEDLELAVDAVIEELDPDACRRFREAAKSCDVQFGKRDDATGTKSLYGRLLAVDADLGERVLKALAGTVCKGDPRSRRQLRSAALGALFRGQDRLVCLCGDPECVAASIPSAVRSVVIHVLAEHGALDAALAQALGVQQSQGAAGVGTPPRVDFEALAREPLTDTAEEDTEPSWANWTSDPTEDDEDDGDDGDEEPPWGKWPSPDPTPGPDGPDTSGATEPETDAAQEQAATPDESAPQPDTAAEPDQPAAQAAPRPRVRPAVTLEGTIVPTALLAELIRTGATVAALPVPPAAAEPRHAFSGPLRRFIHSRDLRCRFPGCNRSAAYADIDHTTPYGAAGGPTHASNGKVLCREHHLAKTFRDGPDGWRDEQLPTGEILWTAPTGHQYLTDPAAILVFPGWDTQTATLPPPTPTNRAKTNPGLTMPTRKRTRRQDREQRIKTEREYNATQRALGHDRTVRPPPGWRG